MRIAHRLLSHHLRHLHHLLRRHLHRLRRFHRLRLLLSQRPSQRLYLHRLSRHKSLWLLQEISSFLKWRWREVEGFLVSLVAMQRLSLLTHRLLRLQSLLIRRRLLRQSLLIRLLKCLTILHSSFHRICFKQNLPPLLGAMAEIWMTGITSKCLPRAV